MNQRTNIPVACTLTTSEQARASEAYKNGLFRHAIELRPREDGASLRFAWDANRIRELGEFLVVETSCCAFMDHWVEVPRGKQDIWLHFTWPEEAREAMREELRQILPAGLEAKKPTSTKGRSRGSKSWLARAGVGFTGLGLLSLACCLAPALGMTALVAGGAGLMPFLDPIAGGALAIGVALLVWWQLTRKKTSCGPGC